MLRVLTYSSNLEHRAKYLLTSSWAHSIAPSVLGSGELSSRWGKLQRRILAVQQYVSADSVADDDVVLFADANDVLIFAGEGEILSRFEFAEELYGKSIIFNREGVCSPAKSRYCQNLTAKGAGGPYLNAGLWMGRAWAVRRMLRGVHIPDDWRLSDQGWYQDYALDHPGEVALDAGGVALDYLKSSPTQRGWHWEGKRLVNEHGHAPIAVHFVSQGHQWKFLDSASVHPLHDTFCLLEPACDQIVPTFLVSAYDWSSHFTIPSEVGIYLSVPFRWAWHRLAATMCATLAVLYSILKLSGALLSFTLD